MNTKTVENIISGYKKELMSDVSKWMSYLETASYHYKHPLDYQVMINVYMPEAMACGDSNTWNKLNRNIISENGIPITQNGEVGYLYDISQTEKREDGSSRTPWIWGVEDKTLNIDYSDTVNKVLSEKYDLKSSTLFENLYELAFNLTENSLSDNDSDYINLVAESTAYCVMTRCCPDKAGVSLANLKKLHEQKFDVAAADVNRIASGIMSEIEAVCKSERSKYIELRRKNNDNQRRKDDRRNSSRSEQNDRRMVSGNNARQIVNDMDIRRTLGESEISAPFGEEAQSVRNNNTDEKTAVFSNGRSRETDSGAYENNGIDGSGIRPDTDGRSSSVLQDSSGLLEGDIRRTGTDRESSREVHNTSQRISDESSAGRIHENERTGDSESSSGVDKSEGARNARYADRQDERGQRGLSDSEGKGRVYENSTSVRNVQQRSGRSGDEGYNLRLKAAEYGYFYPGMKLIDDKEEALSQYIQGKSVYLLYPDNTEGEAESRDEIEAFDGYFGIDVGTKVLEKDFEIFGNTTYRYIPKKTYRRYESETALKIAAELSKSDIKFSGKIAGEMTTLTFSKEDLNKVEQFAAEFANGESQEHIKLLTATKRGNFYEFYNEDAKTVAKELDLMLFSRDNVPMCGIAEHGISKALAQLKEKGYEVTLGEDMTAENTKNEPLRHVSFTESNQPHLKVLNSSDISIADSSEKVKDDSEAEYIITQQDIDVLRTLEPRKSILNFTAEEIRLTENWQKRFEADIDRKSPYYRAVNGDWRENDDTKISILEVEDKNVDFKSVRNDIKSQVIYRGTVINADTDWNIQISRNGLEDTVKYAFKFQDVVTYNLLYHIGDIVSNSILFDTTISEANNTNKAHNTAFMHKMYSLFKYHNELYLAKLAVEEFSDNRNGTLKRMYNVQDIKIEPLRHIEFAENQLARSILNSSDISIAELFAIVKSNDRDFYTNVRSSEKEFAIGELENDLPKENYAIGRMTDGTYALYSLCSNNTIAVVRPFIESEQQAIVLFSEISRSKTDTQCILIDFEQMQSMVEEPKDASVIYRINANLDVFREKASQTDTHSVAEYIRNENGTYAIGKTLIRGDYEHCNSYLKTLVNEKEFAIGESENNSKSYRIYQIKGGEEYHGIRFSDYETLEKSGFTPNFSDYDMVYQSEQLDTEVPDRELLESIYTIFNTEYPEGFNGHSLSVSDVVVIDDADKSTAYFVDSVGYKEVSDFFIDKEIQHEENFKNADIIPQMAKTVLSWDEIESLGYCLFEEGYINSRTPSEKSIYGTSLHEPALYDLVNRMRNGEDIEAELAKALLGGKQVFSIDEYEEIEAEHSAEGLTARYGNAERFIGYEEMGKAFFSLIQEEYYKILIDRIESEEKQQFNLRYEFVNDELRVYNTLNDNKTVAFINSDRETQFLAEDTLSEDIKAEVLHMAEHYVLPYNMPEPEAALPGEPIVTLSNSEHPEINGEMKYPLSQADRIMSALDEKQRSDREIYENAGWYHKTDFSIEFEIDGEKNNYEGRYDIGDGDGTITNHIKSYAQYMLKEENLKGFYDDETREEARERFSYILNELIPVFEKYSNAEKYSPVISAENYNTANAEIVEYMSNGKDIKSVDIPITVSDELRHRFELFGLKPSDEQTQITLSTYGDDNWNRFEIRDKFGNRWVNVNATDILTPDELRTMKSVVSEFYKSKEAERSNISDMLAFAEKAYEDSQKTGKNLYIYNDDNLQQMSLFGDSEAVPIVNSSSRATGKKKTKAVSNIAPTISMGNHILRGGSNEPESLMRIVAYFQKGKTVEENARFLRHEFGTDGRGYKYTENSAFLLSAWFDNDGITYAVSNTAFPEGKNAHMDWNEAAERIEQLLENGEYCAQEIIDSAHQNELKDISSRLWDLKHDCKVDFFISDEIINHLYPDSVKRISECLEDKETLQSFVDGMSDFVKQYNADKSILNFNYHKPEELLERLTDLQREHKTFTTKKDFEFEPEFFVTEDEKDKLVGKGSSFVGGKFRIAEFFEAEHTAKEKADFLKNEYGIGGNGRRGFNTNHDSKGLEYIKGTNSSKPDCMVVMKWNEVAERVERLISEDKFITQNEIDSYVKSAKKTLENADPNSAFDKYSIENAEKILEKYDTAPETMEIPEDAVEPVSQLHEENSEISEELDTNIVDKKDNAESDKPTTDRGNYSFQYKLLSRMKSDCDYMLGNGGAGAIRYLDDKNIDTHINNMLKLYNRFPDSDKPQWISVEEIESLREKLKALVPNTENYHINEDDLSAGGAKSQFKANLIAIQTLKAVEAEERPATFEEQKLMSRYAGWGGLSSAFDSTKSEWANEYAQLKDVLSDEEYTSARASVGDSFYTPPFIIDSIYTALKNMGFEGGNVLEPALGVGNFLGKMPEEMYNKSRIYGTELDSISGRIAKQLYPDADIAVTGFEKRDFSDGFFDVAVGNVPFGSFKIADRKYDKHNFAVHDYFFAKTLDKVRPGGIVAFVTSKGTLDKANPAVRKYISQRAELLGAVRLPNNAFKSYAGTEVTSDIIFLQKREKMIDIAPEWVYTGNDKNGLPCNQYFIDNPDMILGTTVEGNKLYGSGTMVVPFENSDLKELLSEAIQKIQGKYEKEKAVVASNTKQETEKPEVIPADPSVKNFTYTVIDDKLYYRENSVMTEMKFKGKKLDRVKGMAEINKCVRELLDMQLADYPIEDITEKQSELNTLHDKFIKEFGLLSSKTNKSAFKEDISYPLLMSLEKVKDGELEAKADIFTKRTIRPPVKITHVDTAVEALAVSISEKACVDLGFMGSLMGGSDKIEQIIADLKGVIYKNPEKGDDMLSGWETADEYLSGNIREKLTVAQAAVERDELYSENVTALETVMPKRLEPGEINVKLGSAWIDTKYIAQFIYETLGTPLRCQGENRIDVMHSIKTATWTILNKSLDSGNVKAKVTYGTTRKNAYEIIEDSLNQRDTTVNDRVEDEYGNVRYVLNHKETVLARQKQEALNLAFRDWIFKDHERRDYLVEKYNVMFNSIRPREYDGSHLTFVGMNPEMELRPHQKNAVAHALYGGNTLFAHEVGAGKTYEMIATAMEGKRLGLCTKSLIAVPNHMTEQFANDFMDLYPNANILVAGEKDFSKENRQKLCSKIATGDFDAVIIGHSQLIKIAVSPEREEQFIREQIAEVTNDIAEIKAQNGERYTIKEMEKTKKDMEARLKKLLDRTQKDDVITFEQLGVDKLFIDEADMFKNLGLSTKMRNISGVAANTKVQKTQDLYLKCQYLDELTGGKGIVFATGTPVSNSISEIFTMQRYLQSDLLRKHQLTHFDTWAANFAEKVTKLEFAPEGTGFRQKTRLAKFFNLPELMTMFKECADIKTAEDLNLPTPECEIHNVAVQPTQTQKDLVASLGERAEKIHNKMVTSDVDNMLKITTDGRKIGLDQRLVNPMLPDEPGTKVNTCIDNVYRIWSETSENRSTQLVFCDYGVPSTTKTKTDNNGNDIIEEEADFSKFNVYDDIRNKLIERGVPENEIAFIHSAKTKEAKEKLFESVRRGDVRILIGSTSKMGAGTNVQNKLVASHDLDCPWKPRDMEQRRGRMVRQGNENINVHLFRYVTQDTFDAYLFQTLENKQKFISQIMSSKTPARSCDDIDDSTLNYAEVKALCIANPHIKEKMELDIEVSKLQMIKSNFMNEHYRLEDEVLKKIPTRIAAEKEMLKYYQADFEQSASYPPVFDAEGKEKFYPMTVNGKVYAEKQEAGAALIEQALKVTVSSGKNAVTIGEYKGFKLDVLLDSFEGCVKMYIKGKASYSINMSESATGNITRIDNAINSIAKRIEETRDNISGLEVKLEDSKIELSRPFPQEQELNEKLARQTELSYLLNLDNNEDKEQAHEQLQEAQQQKKREDLSNDDISI